VTYDDKGRRHWNTSELSSFNHLPDQTDKIDPENIKKIPTVSDTSYLKTREGADIIRVDEVIGKITSASQNPKSDEKSGFYCKTCDCVLKDSTTYTDHLNGKRHNRMLGNNMKVERVTADTVKNKLLQLKRKADKPVTSYGNFLLFY